MIEAQQRIYCNNEFAIVMGGQTTLYIYNIYLITWVKFSNGVNFFKFIIIIIIILESAVQGRERVRTLYRSKDPNPTQPTHGRKKKIKHYDTKKKEKIMPTGKHWLCS